MVRLAGDWPQGLDAPALHQPPAGDGIQQSRGHARRRAAVARVRDRERDAGALQLPAEQGARQALADDE